MPDASRALARLARSLGVATRYTDGLGRQVAVRSETLVHACAALGAPIDAAADAAAALGYRDHESENRLLAPVVVAWNGRLRVPLATVTAVDDVELRLEDGTLVDVDVDGTMLSVMAPLPLGYHRLRVEAGGRTTMATAISTPDAAWRRPDAERRWGIGAHLAALRSGRSRSTGDLADLRTLCDWVGEHGGSVVSLLPLLPTFNDAPTEPSPYSSVSRLFWSELALDLGAATVAMPRDGHLDVERSASEVRTALGDVAGALPSPNDELERYACFRGAQRRLGRDWRTWPARQRTGRLDPSDIDPDEQRFHRAAQTELIDQFTRLRGHLDTTGVGLGLDLAVGVHPHGYDAWSRSDLFVAKMSVGAPPDAGFPSGQGWGFPPVHPTKSQQEGHAYFAASVAHQAAVADVLRVDHIMAMQRLYWIPEGMDLSDGTYVDYPLEEMFAVLCLESHRNQCQIVGENLGTVAPEVDDALSRHGILGMYLAEFDASGEAQLVGPSATEVAMIGTHDTPLFAGWLDGVDIDERVDLGLLRQARAGEERTERAAARRKLESALGAVGADGQALLSLVLEMLGESLSPLVLVWLEDLWLERGPVNIPGSASDARPNWVRPISRPLDAVLADRSVIDALETLSSARSKATLSAGRTLPPSVEPTISSESRGRFEE